MKSDTLWVYLEFTGTTIADSYAENKKLRYVKTEHFFFRFLIFLYGLLYYLRPHYLRFSHGTHVIKYNLIGTQ